MIPVELGIGHQGSYKEIITIGQLFQLNMIIAQAELLSNRNWTFTSDNDSHPLNFVYQTKHQVHFCLVVVISHQ